MTIIHDEVDIKENKMQQNSAKQILHSFPENETFFKSVVFTYAIIISTYEVFS